MIRYYRRNKTQNTRRKHKCRKATPYKWLRDLISSIDFGNKKVKWDGTPGVPHMNTITDVMAAYNGSQWWRIDRLCNVDFDDHFSNRETYYFTAGNGRRVIIMGDVDCKRFGTLAGALAYCKFLSETFLPGLYYEPSTNGRGAHFYIVVETNGLRGKYFNELLLHHLAPYLNELAKGFDIEFVEVKGTMPDFEWGEAKGHLRAFRCGCLAKLPRDVSRFEEWQRTTVINVEEFRSLPVGKGPSPKAKATLANNRATGTAHHSSPEAGVSAVNKQKEEGKTSLRGTRATSCSGTLIGDDELELMRTRYLAVAERLMNGKSLKTSGKHVATPEDMAILLCIGKFCTDNMNDDGTLPFDRIEGLWMALKDADDINRPFNSKRYGVVRNLLSGLGLLDWADPTYVIGRNDDGSRNKKTGRACKWRFSAELMEMLHEAEKGEGKASLRGTAAPEVAHTSSETAIHADNPAVKGSEEERESILEGHSVPETIFFTRPKQIMTTFDHLAADELVHETIMDWGDALLAA